MGRRLVIRELTDLPAIAAFVAVAESGGFRAAAITLGMSSSGVSKAVARLERRMGVQLLVRTTRSVRLTDAGSIFHEKSRSILTQLHAAEMATIALASAPQGRLTIGMSSSAFGREHILPVIAAFLRRHPQVEIHARLSDRMVDLVEEGVDLAVRIGELPDSTMKATRIGRTGFVLCASPEYLLASGTPVHPDDLARHAFVGFASPGTSKRFEYRFMVDGSVRSSFYPSQLTVDDGQSLVPAALHGLGIVMVVDYLVEAPLRDGRLVRLLRAFEMPALPINVLQPPSRHRSPAAGLFIEMLRTALH